jgi:large subunit ribosomal protein L14e
MINVGRVCVKLAGRDAGKKCVIVDVLDDKTVLIDGETRRRKCNILHIEPLDEVLVIEKNASHDKICKAIGTETKESKKKEKTERPKRTRIKKAAEEAKETKAAKKEKQKKEKKEKTKEKAEKKAEKEKAE